MYKQNKIHNHNRDGGGDYARESVKKKKIIYRPEADPKDRMV